MTPITHALVGLALSKFFPGTPAYFAVAFSLIPDVDHVVVAVQQVGRGSSLLDLNADMRDESGFLRARTTFHELFGVAFWGLMSLLLAAFQFRLGMLLAVCVAVHFFLDFASARSRPFRPLSDFTIDFTPATPFRIVEELLVALCSGLIFLA